MKMTKQSSKRAVIKLLGGVVVVIGLILPKLATAQSCPYYYQNIKCHTGYGWTGPTGQFGLSYRETTAFIYNCVTGSIGNYASYGMTTNLCIWTKYTKNLFGHIGQKNYTNSMASRYCANPCGW